MEDRKPIKDLVGAKTAAGSKQIERIVAGIASQLPLFDPKDLDEAVAEARERPRAALQFLLQQISSGNAAMRAISARLLERIGGPEVVDDLNALIFDAEQDSRVKVLANDILRKLGSPMDADVFAMSVPSAEKEQEKLPSRVLELVGEGKTDEAVEHARRLADADRWLVLFSVVEQCGAASVPILEQLSRDNEENATSVVAAVAQAKLAEGVPLLLELQNTGGRDFQKLLRRILYDLRKAGVAVPEEKSEETQPTPAGKQADDEGLPLFRAMMSQPSAQGMILVTVARRRPNGRLKVFSVVVDLWKHGIYQAGLRLDMSRSGFDRFVQGQSASRLKMREAHLEECRKMVARGVRVAQEFGTALPYDFGIGRALLGDLDREIAEIENPFLCSKCGHPLDVETIERIRAAAPYEHMPVETRCKTCRE